MSTKWQDGEKKLPPEEESFGIYAKLSRDKVDTFFEERGIDIKGKNILEVGPGRGLEYIYMYELGANMVGFDPLAHTVFLSSWLYELSAEDAALFNEHYQEQEGYKPFPHGNSSKIYPDYVEHMPEKLFGTFDYVVSFKNATNPTSMVIIAKALKDNGTLLVTFNTGGDENSEHVKAMRKVFGTVEQVKPAKGDSAWWIASRPLVREDRTSPSGLLRGGENGQKTENPGMKPQTLAEYENANATFLRLFS